MSYTDDIYRREARGRERMPMCLHPRIDLSLREETIIGKVCVLCRQERKEELPRFGITDLRPVLRDQAGEVNRLSAGLSLPGKIQGILH